MPLTDIVLQLRRLLDTEQKKRTTPFGLCIKGILLWTALCAIGYAGLIYVRNSLTAEASTKETVQAMEAIRVLLGIWWPFIWTIPTLIVSRRKLRPKKNHGTKITAAQPRGIAPSIVPLCDVRHLPAPANASMNPGNTGFQPVICRWT